MMERIARRMVVTGHDKDGRSRVASDTVVAGAELPGSPGFHGSTLWGSDTEMHYPDQGQKPKFTEYFPPRNGTRLVEIFMPAGATFTQSDTIDTEALTQAAPGLAETLSSDQPGMHRTATMDFVVILEGRCMLQLDIETVELNAGDVLIESGTMHAWSNPFDAPCKFIAAIVGAQNELCEV